MISDLQWRWFIAPLASDGSEDGEPFFFFLDSLIDERRKWRCFVCFLCVFLFFFFLGVAGSAELEDGGDGFFRRVVTLGANLRLHCTPPGAESDRFLFFSVFFFAFSPSPRTNFDRDSTESLRDQRVFCCFFFPMIDCNGGIRGTLYRSSGTVDRFWGFFFLKWEMGVLLLTFRRHPALLHVEQRQPAAARPVDDGLLAGALLRPERLLAARRERHRRRRRRLHVQHPVRPARRHQLRRPRRGFSLSFSFLFFVGLGPFFFCFLNEILSGRFCPIHWIHFFVCIYLLGGWQKKHTSFFTSMTSFPWFCVRGTGSGWWRPATFFFVRVLWNWASSGWTHCGHVFIKIFEKKRIFNRFPQKVITIVNTRSTSSRIFHINKSFLFVNILRILWWQYRPCFIFFMLSQKY